MRLRIGLDQGMTARETSRPGNLAGIKLKLLYSLRQRERNCIRQLLFCNTVQGTCHHILHACIPPHMLSKPGQPRGITGQNYKFRAFYASGIQYSVFRVSGFEFRVSSFGLRVSGFGFRVSGLRFRALGYIFDAV